MGLNKKVMVYVLLLILPLNSIALFVTREAMDSAIKQTAVIDSQFAESCVENLSGRMQNALSLLYFFTTNNSDCIQMMRQRDEHSYMTAKLSFFVELKTLAHMTDGADGYFFYLQKMEDSLFFSENAVSESFKATALPQALSGLSKQRWSICSIAETNYLVLLQEYSSTLYGAWINLDYIRDDLVSRLDYDTTEALFYQGDVQPVDDSRVGAAFTKRGVTLSVTQEREAVLRNISLKERFLYALALAYLIAIPLLGWFIHSSFLKPLKTVTKANREIKEGNLSYRIDTRAKSPEFREVFSSFNAMADDLQTTKVECYDKEIEKQKVELCNLQLQIRPHFLLNHFNLIYTLLQRNQGAQIEDTILYLSDYFRYIFRSGQETELFGKELDIIRGHIKVANIRYHNLIDAVIDVAPEVERVSMPPLLIHNFVENAIKHAIRTANNLHVLIEGRYENNFVIFRIKDDGNGMDNETLERNRRIFCGEINLDNQNEHIGLYNSYRRLKLIFGEEASIDVQSEQGVGTCFTIRFPYTRRSI